MIKIFKKPSIRKLEKGLLTIKDEIDKEAEKLLKQKGKEIKELAVDKAPHETGELKDSAYSRKIPKELRVRVGFKAKHALIVHEQPQSMREDGERHFLTNAKDEVLGKDNEKLIEELQERVIKVWKKKMK